MIGLVGTAHGKGGYGHAFEVHVDNMRFSLYQEIQYVAVSPVDTMNSHFLFLFTNNYDIVP